MSSVALTSISLLPHMTSTTPSPALHCTSDDVHPQDHTGHHGLADLIVSLVQQTALDLARQQLGAEDEELAKVWWGLGVGRG